MNSLLKSWVLFLACTAIAYPVMGEEMKMEKKQVSYSSKEIVYKPASPDLPKGVEIAVLEGDPKSEGWFTMRLKAPKNMEIPVHKHPADARVTVISGTFYKGYGEVFDRAKAKKFDAGSFSLTPAETWHFVFTKKKGCVLQLTAKGPWGMEPKEKKGLTTK